MDTSLAPTPLFLAPRTLRVATTIGAAGLFAFGVFSWIAANWADFHRLAKLGLVSALLLTTVVSAIFAPRTRTPVLLVATAAVGGLLALIGQIYPSGADAWQLFAAWALLALPFALAARHDAVWVLWAIVASVAIGLWQSQEHGGVASVDFGPAWTLAIALALILAPLEPLRAITGGTRWAFRFACFSAIALITFTGLIGLFDTDLGSGTVLAALTALIAAAGALLSLRPLEFGVLTLVCAGLDALLIGILFKLFIPDEVELLSSLTIGLLAAALVAGSVVLLRLAHARYAPPRETSSQSSFSWPLAALSGFGALLAALPFLVLFGLVIGESTAGAFFCGVLTLGIGIAVLRDGKPFGFRQMFGFIAAVIGFLLFSFAVVSTFDVDNAGFAMALVAVLTAGFTPVRWVRAVLGFATLPALASSTIAHAFFSFSIEPSIVVLMVAAGAAGLIFVARETEALEPWRPFFSGWNVAGLLVLMLLAGRPFLIGVGPFGEFSEVILATGNRAMLSLSVLLGGAGAGLLFWRYPELRKPLGFAVAACAVALTFRAPALGAAILVFAAAVLVQSRSLATAATLAILWIISTFYYALSWTLTEKAYVLMALGAALGVVIFLTRSRSEAAPDKAPFATFATALVALGAVATFGVAGASVYGAERVLRDGRVIYLELRPVDPRSLLQGDYMALAFNTDNLPSPEVLNGITYALAEVDARSVATLQTLLPADAQPAPNQILLQLRAKSDRWFIGSDAFFFQEGTGDAFEGAKYGQFRVGDSGRLLLTGLADADLRLLP
jgi:uncharacterized membrane-anchored protein/uncharacterized membrane protein